MVHSQTQRYNTKIRAGRGFTLAELKAAKIPVKYAPTIGICVDHRRKNRSQEGLDVRPGGGGGCARRPPRAHASLQANVKRLLAYKDKLVLFPRRRVSKAKEASAKPKAGDSSAAECAAATQLTAALLPISKAAPVIESVTVTAAIKATKAYATLRVERMNTRMVGIREKKMKEAAKEAEEKAKA